jgi:lysophospholipase L1-like esterase
MRSEGFGVPEGLPSIPVQTMGGIDMKTHFLLFTLLFLFASSLCRAQIASEGKIPTLFLIGDSTVRNHTKGQLGWGDPLVQHFDLAKIKVINRALGGRSSRTFLTEGLWDKVLAEIKPGDYVLMQFGHNDGGSLNDPKGRASIKGNGDETQEVANATTGVKETVHSYGWYLRRYIKDAKSKGATAIVLSPVPRKIWKDDKTVARASGDYGKWAMEAAKQEDVAFIDLNDLIATRYEALGKEKVETLFGDEHTHTNAAGAEINAEMVVVGLKSLKDSPFTVMLAPNPAGVKLR